MDKKMMERLEDGFCEVLQDYAEKGMKSPECVETAKAALSGLLKIRMLEEMENFSRGYSSRGYYNDEGGSSNRGYRDGGSSNRGYRDGGGSYRRSRDGGYSGHNDKLMSRLEELRDQAGNDRERQMIEEFISKMEK